MKEQLTLFEEIAAAKSLYCFDNSRMTFKNAVIPNDIYNAIHPRPSLIPGVEYTISAKEVYLLDLVWQHAVNHKSRGFL